jgi:hypothetical protein
MYSIGSIRKIARVPVYLGVTLIAMKSHSLSANEGLSCPAASKFWEAETTLTRAREELNAKKYATADATIKTAISKLGIPEDAPRCQDCMDEGNLQFPAIEAAEITGNIKYAAVARYDDFHELIEIYVRRQCHIVPDQEWTDHYTPQAPMSASSP